ncbi:hypothetical protein L5M28_07405 [Shewanella sp. SW32]|uniref:hypothetical protein n=1 Tax=unclassified Shewanella TaxID=196818 RepID=UPI0021DAD21F|nr:MULTISPECIES: hypothetical protein [unclassified Shewanella]MCU7962404.1 hypothetical protein [Shewanella sp. SW32]MCU7969254.1 hypothetical protein [Shewanella sp. SW29]
MKTNAIEIKHAARSLAAERKRLGVGAPACALPPNTTDDLTESKEEREAFELLDEKQQISAMVAIARECPTTSLTGICTRLFKAGCRMNQ